MNSSNLRQQEASLRQLRVSPIISSAHKERIGIEIEGWSHMAMTRDLYCQKLTGLTNIKPGKGYFLEAFQGRLARNPNGPN